MAFKYTVKKGDTLNAIARRFGFRNYREAGITSVPSGNFDLIRPNDEITIGNYNPQNVSTIPNQSPTMVSSQDNTQMFYDNKQKLDELVQAHRQASEQSAQDDTDTQPADFDEAVKSVKSDTSDDDLYSWARLDDEQKIKEAQKTLEQDRKEYLDSIKTRLAEIDDMAKATIRRIETSSARRIAEQKRINKLNIDRIRAYGIAGGGMYKPIMFSDAVTERERKASEIIQQLESERDSAIQQALNLAERGKSLLLKEKMEYLKGIEDRLRKQLQDIERESNKQYELLRQMRKAEEERRQQLLEKQRKQLLAYVKLREDEFTDLTPEQLQQKVKELASETGLSFGDVLGVINTAKTSRYKELAEKYAMEKKKADANLAKSKILTERARRNKVKAGTAKKGSSSITGKKRDDDPLGLNI